METDTHHDDGGTPNTIARLADGTLDAATLADDTLARIDAHEVALGAFTALLPRDAARREAATAQRERRGPLHGLPVGVKDIVDTVALPTAYGSPVYAGHRPRSDAALVGAIRRAGGVVIGKTTSTEFAYLHPTATLNPNAPGRTPGGSSAGSAAAVAAGLVELAIGTQTGGSVIRPASYCGAVGYKPSFGWLPTAGVRCFSWSLDTVGLFTRTVADAAFFAQALAGRRFAATRPTPTVAPRFGLVTDYPWGPLSAAMATALQEAAARLRAAGHTVREVRLPAWAAAAFEAQATVQGWEAVRSLHTELTQHADALSPLLRDYLREASRTIGDADYDAAQRVAAAAREALAEDGLAPHGVDVLLTPSAPDEAPLLSEHSTGAASYNRLWTLLGAPCVGVPGLRGPHGAPLGLQVIGARGADAECLRAAAVLEAVLQPQR